MRELLRTNAGCKLPCWWGIVPGKTTWAEAESFLNHLGVRIGSKSLADGTILHGIGGTDFDNGPIEEIIWNRFGFVERDERVDSILVLSDSGSNYTGWHHSYKIFAPQQVLSTYGAPSRIYLQTSSTDYGDPGIESYTLRLYYDHLGIAVKYFGRRAVIRGNNYHVCPNFDDEDLGSLEMLLQSASNPEPLDRIDENTEWFRKSTKSIEEATGLSREDFYLLFTQEDKPACFDAPIDIWPDLSEYRPN